MKIYITFGQDHKHTVYGKTFDKNCVAIIEAEDEAEGRNMAFKLFDNKWCYSYTEATWRDGKLDIISQLDPILDRLEKDKALYEKLSSAILYIKHVIKENS